MKYHFEFCIPHGASSVDLTLPTAPMYIEGSTYSGLCKIWLKRANLPLTLSGTLMGGLGEVNAMLEFNTQAKNRFYLTTGSASGLENCGSNAIFEIPVNNETSVISNKDMLYVFTGSLFAMNQAGDTFGAYPFYASVDTDGAGNLTTRDNIPLVARTFVAGGANGGAIDASVGQEPEIITLAPRGGAGTNNDGGVNVAPIFPVALHANSGLHTPVTQFKFGVSNLASNGVDDLGMSVAYHNKVLDDRDCLIIGSCWGSRLTAKMKTASLENGLAQDNVALVSNGVCRFELVVEPLKNDESVEVGV